MDAQRVSIGLISPKSIFIYKHGCAIPEAWTEICTTRAMVFSFFFYFLVPAYAYVPKVSWNIWSGPQCLKSSRHCGYCRRPRRPASCSSSRLFEVLVNIPCRFVNLGAVQGCVPCLRSFFRLPHQPFALDYMRLNPGSIQRTHFDDLG